jgi:tetratricopeptide (TPR) repeat protein
MYKKEQAMSQRKKELPILSTEQLLALVAQQKQGQPDYGALLRYFRQRMGWEVRELASYYSAALRAEGLEDEEIEPLGVQRMYAMENQNKAPRDQKRRWMLATLPDIPPALFGLESASPQGRQFLWKPIDVAEYRAALVQYCAAFRVGDMQDFLADIKRRISTLHREAPFANSIDKQEMFTLLCGYYVLAGDYASDQMRLGEAIGLHSRAITIAEENTLYDLWAYALRQRGNAYTNRGQITAALKGFAAAQADFAATARDMQAAQHLEARISPHRQATIALSAGATLAWTARDRQELLKALKVIDQATGQIDAPADEQSIITLHLDQERYHLNRAVAFLASSFQIARSPAGAWRALEEATRATAPTHRRRQTDNALLLAKSYLVEGLYPMATTYAGDALDLVKDISSRWSLTYIEGLYRGLRASRYGKNPEVARLGVKLLRVQRPDLFA